VSFLQEQPERSTGAWCRSVSPAAMRSPRRRRASTSSPSCAEIALLAAAAAAAALGWLPALAAGAEPRFRTVEAVDVAHERVLKLANVRIRGDLEIGDGLRKLTAARVVFDGRVSIAPLERPRPTLMFERVTFRENVDLYLGEFESVEFDECRFEADATFHSIRASSLDLISSTFDGHAIFVAMNVEQLNLADVHFEKSVDFSGASIGGEPNLTRIRTEQPIEIAWSQFGKRWLDDSLSWALSPGEATPDDRADTRSRLRQVEADLRFWKRNFTEIGREGDSREANFQAIKLRRERFFKTKRIDSRSAKQATHATPAEKLDVNPLRAFTTFRLRPGGPPTRSRFPTRAPAYETPLARVWRSGLTLAEKIRFQRFVTSLLHPSLANPKMPIVRRPASFVYLPTSAFPPMSTTARHALEMTCCVTEQRAFLGTGGADRDQSVLCARIWLRVLLRTTGRSRGRIGRHAPHAARAPLAAWLPLGGALLLDGYVAVGADPELSTRRAVSLAGRIETARSLPPVLAPRAEPGPVTQLRLESTLSRLARSCLL
jgi:hypothetical protein